MRCANVNNETLSDVEGRRELGVQKPMILQIAVDSSQRYLVRLGEKMAVLELKSMASVQKALPGRQEVPGTYDTTNNRRGQG
jgi:hypothetical protein